MADIDEMASELRDALRADREDGSDRRSGDRRSASEGDAREAERRTGERRSGAAQKGAKPKGFFRRPAGILVLVSLVVCLAGGGLFFLTSADLGGTSSVHERECMDMASRYAGADAVPPLTALVGLSGDTGASALPARCREFAGAVTRMEKVSPREHHAFLCVGALYRIDALYAFAPSADNHGVKLVSFRKTGSEETSSDVKVYPIAPGQVSMVRDWQFYNMGDGCLVVGYSDKNAGGFTWAAAPEK